MACQLLPAHDTSVLQRRGFTLPEISVSPQDFYGRCCDDTNDETNKILLKNILQYLISPRKTPGGCRKSSIDAVSKLKFCPTPVVTDIPRFIAEEEFERYLTDIKLEDIITDTPDNTISETFLSHLSNSKSKVTLLPTTQFTNESGNFLENYDFDDKDITLLLPKSIDLITPGTPVIVKRAIKDDRDEFDVYFPDIYTPNLVQRGLQENGSFFKFPDTPENLCDILLENKENNFITALNELENSNFDLINKPFTQEPIWNDQTYTFDIDVSSNASFGDGSSDVCMENELSESKPKTKKNQNELERKRRVEQHQRFQKLRATIPRISEKKKMAKITILQAAVSYIGQLHQEGTMLEQTMTIEKRRNDFLMRKLAFLSKST